MKYIASLFTVLLFLIATTTMKAQNYYSQQWKKIEVNAKKGAFKSNLPIILEIQNQATKDNNAIELIKSLKAEFSIVEETNDDTKNNTTSEFFAKLKPIESQLKGNDQLLYKVLLGEFFAEYYDNNSWDINERTNLSQNEDFKNIESWTKLDFRNYLTKNFSELGKENLNKIELKPYESIFEKNADFQYYPTLAAWNTSQQIKFLQNSNLFTPNERKENHPKILNLYDELIKQNTGNPYLYFAHQKLNYNCNFTHCKDQLSQLRQLYDSPQNGDYKVMIANDMAFEMSNDKKQKEALAFIDSVKKQFPSSPFLNNLKNQENSILQPSISIFYETETQAGKPIQLIAYSKNATSFSLKIYQTTDIQGLANYIYDNYRNPFSLIYKNLVKKEDFTLPNPNDYQYHKTALEISPLPAGIYLAEYIVNNTVQNFYFFVSESRILTQNIESNSSVLQKLVSRENGKILSNENIEIYEFVPQKPYKKTIIKTDNKGVFQFPPSENKNYYRYYMVKNGENNYQWFQIYGERNSYIEKPSTTKAQIFLDRAIYRPGQTVYFKVINTQLKDKKEVVSAQLPQKITLYDANGQEVSSQNFTTNEFGSYHGSFSLPRGTLNGQFSLKILEKEVFSDKYFRVEEYKRPQFEVNFDPIKEEYQYGQTLEIKGKAISYSGIPLTDVKVDYEIKKQNIRWRYFWWYPKSDDTENSILGSTKTNDKGEFTIKVELKKDESLEGIQIDNYNINASVTDINGETHDSETQLRVASVSHYISAENPGNLFSDENTSIKVETKNYNDQVVQKNYHAQLSKLEEPNKVFRKNFSTQIQDTPKFSPEDFYQRFPHDKYSKKDNLENWKIEKLLFDKTQLDSTLDMGKLSPGTYRLELFNIEGKDTIKNVQNFQVWDKNQLDKNQFPFLKVIAPKGETKRGEKATIYLYSAIPNALVNIFIQNGNGKTQTEQNIIKNGVLKYEVIPPANEEINSLNYQFQLVAFNDVQTQTATIKIADNKKPMSIETLVFRDKILPGQKEKWSIKVNGQEKLQAEVLADMYDQSLDKFASNTYQWQKLYIRPNIIANYALNLRLSGESYSKRMEYFPIHSVTMPNFDWFDGGIYTSKKMYKNSQFEMAAVAAPAPAADAAGGKASESRMKTDSTAVTAIEEVIVAGLGSPETKENTVSVRQNLNETAFFFPELYTDANGDVSFEFTSPEALTRWKLLFLAHTKDAQAATLEKMVVTQKDFSITPNYPRFLREGDELLLQSKLSNLSSQKLSGTARLQILDAFTNDDISKKFNLNETSKTFAVNENGNTAVQWNLKVPKEVSSIIIKIIANAGNFSDGEQKAVAILPNRMLVTDAVPVFVKEGQTKTFTIENLKNANSSSIVNFSNTLELTTNPVWEIMFALPSLKNDTNNSSDVIFNKWFADVLANEIFKANPKMKTVFDEYQAKGLLTSNLEKNQELKQLLLEETPWVLESKSEKEQMEKLARLFDANTMRNSILADWSELQKLQNPDGGFSWVKGYPSSFYNSLYILKNLGRINEWLKDNLQEYQADSQEEMVENLISYIDNEINKKWDVKKHLLWYDFVLDYLDTRHYWEKDYPLKKKGAQLKSLILQEAPKADIKNYTFYGLHRAALLYNQYKLTSLSQKLLTYLKETSTQSETQGVYWTRNLNDWGWYYTKIVNHAGAIEAFQKLTPNDVQLIEEMKIWLITQKEVNSWQTSRGTAEVIFTLLNSGKSWTTHESDKAEIFWGGKALQPQTQATGFVKQSISSDILDKNLASVTIKKDSPGIVQGGLYWQYYEDLNKIKSSESYISITKELYRKIKTVNGEELQKITEQTPLKIGDKVTVRMILNTDRPMEYIHLKDMRAAGFEPIAVLSGYQWKNNLGYYQVTKDASTNFYIEYMPKGKFVFEYDYLCNAAGVFSNGITTLQNYYAPQMNAHSEGMNVKIEE